MSKKHFIALADFIKRKDQLFNEPAIYALAEFCQEQNPQFKRERWLGYVRGTNGKNGGEIK